MKFRWFQRSNDGVPKGLAAYLGEGSTLKGELHFDGLVRLDGRFEGTLQTTGAVVVGQPAEIIAEITAARVICWGQVKGKITASEAVQLLAPARVEGTVLTPSLSLEAGVEFNGVCEMLKTLPSSRAHEP